MSPRIDGNPCTGGTLVDRANQQTCAWCDGPLPTENRVHTNQPRVYCSRECDIARRKVRDYYAEEAEHLLAGGASPEQVCAQLGKKPSSLARALYRERRHDLARAIQSVETRHSHGTCAFCGDRTSKVGRKRCRACAKLGLVAA